MTDCTILDSALQKIGGIKRHFSQVIPTLGKTASILWKNLKSYTIPQIEDCIKYSHYAQCATYLLAFKLKWTSKLNLCMEK